MMQREVGGGEQKKGLSARPFFFEVELSEDLDDHSVGALKISLSGGDELTWRLQLQGGGTLFSGSLLLGFAQDSLLLRLPQDSLLLGSEHETTSLDMAAIAMSTVSPPRRQRFGCGLRFGALIAILPP
jgi:hypothetical protein